MPKKSRARRACRVSQQTLFVIIALLASIIIVSSLELSGGQAQVTRPTISRPVPSVPPPAPATYIQMRCGDGVVSPTWNEKCDDRNTFNGDGCSNVCQIEAGYSCPPTGGRCTNTNPPLCGDGKWNPLETCDDGNKAGGDGCSALCTLERNMYGNQTPVWYCTTEYPTRCWVISLSMQTTCGNGTMDTRRNGEAGEQCDDGQLRNGDGCTSQCRIEPGYLCSGRPSKCTQVPTCGNRVRDPGETCEDANTLSGDGCSSLCQIEPGYTCQGFVCTKPVCGNGIVDTQENSQEQCDDGNLLSGDGCSNRCAIEKNYSCTGARPSECETVFTCGNASLETGEQCDDGNRVTGDGCSAQCSTEAGFSCGRVYQNGGYVSQCIKLYPCGNGIVELTDRCDDGNNVSGDGCNFNCQLESGYVCSGQPSKCERNTCGNGKYDWGEYCDDGNTVAGDGCNATCTAVEPGYYCSGLPNTCKKPVCGNRIIEPTESCDDGNNRPGDGCSLCRLEGGFQCIPDYGCTRIARFCGDGVTHLNYGEMCDDGNGEPGDGCSTLCTVEQYFVCSTQSPSRCTYTYASNLCGNKAREGNEQCDDGNIKSGDGCDMFCRREEGFVCYGASATGFQTPSICWRFL